MAHFTISPFLEENVDYWSKKIYKKCLYVTTLPNSKNLMGLQSFGHIKIQAHQFYSKRLFSIILSALNGENSLFPFKFFTI